MNNFTSGPWKLTEKPERLSGIYARTMQHFYFLSGPQSDSDFVSDVIVSNSDIGRANARLIAESPTMFDVLKKAYKELDDSGAWGMYEGVSDVMGRLKHVIAKVEGKE